MNSWSAPNTHPSTHALAVPRTPLGNSSRSNPHTWEVQAYSPRPYSEITIAITRNRNWLTMILKNLNPIIFWGHFRNLLFETSVLSQLITSSSNFSEFTSIFNFSSIPGPFQKTHQYLCLRWIHGNHEKANTRRHRSHESRLSIHGKKTESWISYGEDSFTSYTRYRTMHAPQSTFLPRFTSGKLSSSQYVLKLISVPGYETQWCYLNSSVMPKRNRMLVSLLVSHLPAIFQDRHMTPFLNIENVR